MLRRSRSRSKSKAPLDHSEIEVFRPAAPKNSQPSLKEEKRKRLPFSSTQRSVNPSLQPNDSRSHQNGQVQQGRASASVHGLASYDQRTPTGNRIGHFQPKLRRVIDLEHEAGDAVHAQPPPKRKRIKEKEFATSIPIEHLLPSLTKQGNAALEEQMKSFWREFVEGRKEPNRMLQKQMDELGNSSKKELKKEINQIKGELIAKMGEYQKQQQLNIHAKMEEYQKHQQLNIDAKMEDYQKQQQLNIHEKMEEYKNKQQLNIDAKMEEYQKQQQLNIHEKMEEYKNKQQLNIDAKMEEYQNKQQLSIIRKGNELTLQNRWDSAACHQDLELFTSKQFIVRHTEGKKGWCSVLAERLIPNENFGIFYYEVHILGQESGIFIGLGTKQMRLDKCVGHYKGTTYAYDSWGRFWGHAVVGCPHSSNGRPYIYNKNRSFGVDDVIGCGVDLATRQIIYTKNGQRLDTADLFVDSADKLFPCVSLSNSGDKIEANFGPDFKYKL